MSNVKSKNDKEREKIVQDRLQILLTRMLQDDDNKYCVDCDSKGAEVSFSPRYDESLTRLCNVARISTLFSSKLASNFNFKFYTMASV